MFEVNKDRLTAIWERVGCVQVVGLLQVTAE